MLDTLLSCLEVLKPYLSHLILSTIVWVTYCYVVKSGGHVSDDLMGICEYDGILQTKTSETWRSTPQDKRAPEDPTKTWSTLRRLFNSEYGMISRWVRFWLCGGNFPSKQQFPDRQGPDGKVIKGEFIPSGKVASRHHALSVLVFNFAILSTYTFLSKILGENVAFLACALFIVHPVVTQGVAWSSGLGYPLSLFWISLGFNLTLHYYTIPNPTFLITILFLAAFALIQSLAVNALFIAMASWVILVFLGHYEFAVVAILISLNEGLRIVRDTIKLRSDEFKKQSMGGSTYLKPRKLIVATKTLLYYLKHTLWPSKMGLYHEWGYHYNESVEREDKYFFLGLLALAGLTLWFFLTPVFAIKFGILWFGAFIFIFLNWITIQQFVTERYAMVPSIGTCIIISYLLQNNLPIYTLIFGIALCRTWLHLPTYDNELRFYLSNTWNFKKSEVAMGNLGVTYIRGGMVGTSLDVWHQSIQTNPDYDVPYYNIYSHYKSNAMFQMSRGNFQGAIELLKQAFPYLEKCIACKVCHFKADWTRELDEVRQWINNPMVLILNEESRLLDLRLKLSLELSKCNDEKRKAEIQPSLNDISNSLITLQGIKNNNSNLVYQARPLTADSLLKSLLT